MSKCTTAKTDLATYLCPNQCELLCKKIGKFFEKEPNFYDLTDAEIEICEKEPLACIQAYSYSWLAEKKCSEIYYSSNQNDESDACRHYIWAFYLVKEFGQTKARKILNAHENNPKQKIEEKEMDIFNNELGLSDFKKDSKNLTYDEALVKFKTNLKNKKFIIIKPRYQDKGGLP